MTIVFDFDKTLTYKDSLSELFKQKSGVCAKVLHLCLKVLSKVGVISVKTEKLTMIKVLFGGSEERFASACREQASTIRLTPVMEVLRGHVANGDRVIVLSASAEYLLKEVFAGMKVEIFGSRFEVSAEGKIKAITQHPFDKEKLDVLLRNDVKEIDDEYFDSPHDECLKSIAKNWHRVADGKIVESLEK